MGRGKLYVLVVTPVWCGALVACFGRTVSSGSDPGSGDAEAGDTAASGGTTGGSDATSRGGDGAVGAQTDASASTDGSRGVTSRGGGVGTSPSLTTSATSAGMLSGCPIPLGLVSDFEDSDMGDGADPANYAFGVRTESGMATGGIYDGSDGSGTPTLRMVRGNDSEYAVSAGNGLAQEWGGGVGIRLSCLNASGFTGLELSLRGATPSDLVSVSVSVDAGSFAASVPISDVWNTTRIPFSEMLDIDGAVSDGDDIVGIGVFAEMVWVEGDSGDWIVEPDGFEIQVDDLSFY